MMQRLRESSAPGTELAGTAQTHITTDFGKPVDHQSTPISFAQIAAWDRLWARLLRPVGARHDESEAIA